jgi:hypothetical protein
MSSIEIKGKQSVGAQVIHADTYTTGDTYDVELADLQVEVYAWADAMKGAVQQLVDDAERPQREGAMLAYGKARDGYNEAIQRLVKAVYARRLEEAT